MYGSADVFSSYLAAQSRDTFLCAQRLQFGKREILGEPARDRLAVDRLRRLSIRIFGMIGDVGGLRNLILVPRDEHPVPGQHQRSEEHTSELQSLMRISYAVFCLKKKNIKYRYHIYMRHKSITYIVSYHNTIYATILHIIYK